jgi:hypothetical protein
MRTDPVTVARVSAISLAAWLALAGCSESLPPRFVPEGPLEISNVLIGQGTSKAGDPIISVSTTVRNAYDETFDGTIDLTAEVRFWWPRRPDVEAHVPLQLSDHIQLGPGATYRVEQTWFLTTDDGRDILDLLTYFDDDIRFGIAYAQPETFVAEVRLTVFEETGLITSGPHEFVLEGWRPVEQDDDG